MKKFLVGTVFAAAAWAASAVMLARAEDLKIALIYSKTGPFEAYAKQTEAGLTLGFEYLTSGTMMLDGRKIVILLKDDQGKPDVAKSLLEQAYADDNVDLAIGTSSSGATLAMLPVAEDAKKLLLVEPAVADSITGDKWNRFIFRSARNSSQDALAGAVALGKGKVSIGMLAQDYAFGHDGVAAFKTALAEAHSEAKVVFEEYAPFSDDGLHRLGAAAVPCAQGQARPQNHRHHLGRPQPRDQDCRHEAGTLRHRARARRQYPAGHAAVATIGRSIWHDLLLLWLPEEPDERLARGRA